MLSLFLVPSNTIYLVAKSWAIGIDKNLSAKAGKETVKTMIEICERAKKNIC